MYLSNFSDGKKNNFDFLRFVAATLVIFSHAFALTLHGNNEPLSLLSKSQTNLGALSVYIFFIASGFLITQSYDRTQNITAFFKARCLRIFPALAVSLLFVIFIIGPICTTLPLSDYFSNMKTYSYFQRIVLFKSEMGLPGVFKNNIYKDAVNGSLWTLGYEFFCYMLVGLLGYTGLLKKKIVILPMFFICYMLFLSTNYFNFGKHINKLSDLLVYFVVGTLLYVYKDKVILNKYIAFISAILLVLSTQKIGTLKYVYPICLSYVVMYIAFSNVIKCNNFSKYGDFSYGIYVYAFPIQQAISYFNITVNPILNFIIAFSIVLPLSYLSWNFVEKPFIKFKNVSLKEIITKNKLLNKLC